METWLKTFKYWVKIQRKHRRVSTDGKVLCIEVDYSVLSCFHAADVFLPQDNAETKVEEMASQKRKVAFCDAPKSSSSTRWS